MNEVFFYIGIAAVIIFVLRLVFYLGYQKGMKDGISTIMSSVEKFFLSIKRVELCKTFLDFLYVDFGGDPKNLHKNDKEDKQ